MFDQKTSLLADEVTNLPIIEVNLDNALDCLLREIRYITGEPLNYKIPGKYRELIPLLDNERALRY